MLPARSGRPAMNREDTLTLDDIDRAVAAMRANAKPAPIAPLCRCQHCGKEWFVTIPRCESCDPEDAIKPEIRIGTD